MVTLRWVAQFIIHCGLLAGKLHWLVADSSHNFRRFSLQLLRFVRLPQESIIGHQLSWTVMVGIVLSLSLQRWTFPVCDICFIATTTFWIRHTCHLVILVAITFPPTSIICISTTWTSKDDGTACDVAWPLPCCSREVSLQYRLIPQNISALYSEFNQNYEQVQLSRGWRDDRAFDCCESKGIMHLIIELREEQLFGHI